MRIKICGITNGTDAKQAALLGADAIGLNFYPPSPRSIDLATAKTILDHLPANVDAIALFVKKPLREAFAMIQALDRIRLVQWHGEKHETRNPAPYQLMPAFAVGEQADLSAISRYVDQCREAGWQPAAVLVDARVPGQYGGTGRRAPWELLADFQPGVPLMLAGGLDPDNIAEAVRIVRPFAVDVASGVERYPRRKDAEKIRRFIANAREAAAKYGSKT